MTPSPRPDGQASLAAAPGGGDGRPLTAPPATSRRSPGWSAASPRRVGHCEPPVDPAATSGALRQRADRRRAHPSCPPPATPLSVAVWRPTPPDAAAAAWGLPTLPVPSTPTNSRSGANAQGGVQTPCRCRPLCHRCRHPQPHPCLRHCRRYGIHHSRRRDERGAAGTKAKDNRPSGKRWGSLCSTSSIDIMLRFRVQGVGISLQDRGMSSHVTGPGLKRREKLFTGS